MSALESAWRLHEFSFLEWFPDYVHTCTSSSSSSTFTSLPTSISSYNKIAIIISEYATPSADQGWKIHAKADANIKIIDTKVFGAPYLLPDELWPCCCFCQREMWFFFQMSTSSFPSPFSALLGNDSIIQLWKCCWDEHVGETSDPHITTTTSTSTNFMTLTSATGQRGRYWVRNVPIKGENVEIHDDGSSTRQLFPQWSFQNDDPTRCIGPSHDACYEQRIEFKQIEQDKTQLEPMMGDLLAGFPHSVSGRHSGVPRCSVLIVWYISCKFGVKKI